MAGRRKRSERLLQESAGLAVATRPSDIERAINGHQEGRFIVNASCPVCGHNIPENRVTVRSKMGALESKPYFESIDWQPDHPFGVRLSAAGKGSFRERTYISPEEAPELFRAMKSRFLDAVKEWMGKGWISEGEVLAVLGELHGPGKPSTNGRHNGTIPQRPPNGERKPGFVK